MIKNPICYSGKSRTLVDRFNSLDRSKKDFKYWNSEEADIIRKQVKDHYKVEQKYICSYCRQQIKVSHSMVWDIEHIVSKSTHPQFMFEPKNLCLACKDCNVTKGAKNVLKKAAGKKYPDRSEDYFIVHPHFDKYDDHIKKAGEDVFIAVTEKGLFTADCCGLFRRCFKKAGWEPKIADSPHLLKAVDELLSLDPDRIRHIELKVVEEGMTKRILIDFSDRQI